MPNYRIIKDCSIEGYPNCTAGFIISLSEEAAQSHVAAGEIKLGCYDFSQILGYVKEIKGARVSRDGWNRKGMWVEVQFPDEGSKNTRPYFFMVVPPLTSEQFGEEGAKEQRVPWAPSQTDLFAEDWQILV